MPIANSLSVYLHGILVGLGVLLGLLFLILPGLYVFARWYLASALLVRDGGGRRAAMQRSWDMLAVQELDHSRQEAETANPGKTRFLAAASHDLLQPLHKSEEPRVGKGCVRKFRSWG